jgi:Ca2+-binding EF-hand superfamily protein
MGRCLLMTAGLAIAAAASAGGDKMQMMDTNKDGMISAEEHSAGARQMFQKMDGNADGNVTAAEMDAMHAQMKPGDTSGPKMSSAEKIKTIDANNDGAITAAEHEAGSRAMFDKMDTNRDGSLSAEEVSAGHAKMTSEGTQ